MKAARARLQQIRASSTGRRSGSPRPRPTWPGDSRRPADQHAQLGPHGHLVLRAGRPTAGRDDVAAPVGLACRPDGPRRQQQLRALLPGPGPRRAEGHRGPAQGADRRSSPRRATRSRANRRRRDAKLLQEKQYQQQAAAARDRVATSVRQQEARLGAGPAGPQPTTSASWPARRPRADRVHRQLMAEIAREQHRGGGYTGPTGGLLMRPVNGPITSPYGYRINPVMHYYGLHDGDDFGAACGTPIWAAGNGHILSEYYSDGLGQPAVPQPRPDQRQERHRDLQPPVGVPHPRRPGGLPRPGRRADRHDGLVDRLPHPHDGDGQRRGREPRALDRLTAPTSVEPHVCRSSPRRRSSLSRPTDSRPLDAP